MLFLFLLYRVHICVSCIVIFRKIYKICGCFIDMRREYASFILVVLVGLAMILGVLAKSFLGFDIDSDWFWFLAGIGLAAEGIISFRRQKRFDKKYKIIERQNLKK